MLEKIAVTMAFAVAVSMDAFAVSITKGLSVSKMRLCHAMLCGIYFGGAQFIMPLIGYVLGSSFEKWVNAISPWIAFVLLGIIGGNMIKEALSKEEIEKNDCFRFGTMIVMAIATSIDALGTGIAIAMQPETYISMPVLGYFASMPTFLIIGLTTFAFSAVGVKIGNAFGAKYKSKAELAGGIILCVIGIYMLLKGIL